jgi:sucrose-6-phosphate hydrolase SacC (GH32 family)
VAEPSLSFHAAPPAGHWINDPNALLFDGSSYQLFAQHRADAPHFRETGWCRFSSPDLLSWTFQGSAIPPERGSWMYSGSILGSDQALEVVHTVHERPLEHQVRRTSNDGGRSWSPAERLDDLGTAARNRRDPYVFRDGDHWALLLAEPCDWTDWESEPPSRLRLYRSADCRRWVEAGVIGPWRSPGIMWEVPLLVRVGGADVLLVSEVDRRSGGAACSVRAWIGTLEEEGFTIADNVSSDGQVVDLGSDFYAMMASMEGTWPAGERLYVAWASNWQTARAMRWPGFSGGPITLPRTLALEQREGAPRLVSRPAPMLLQRFAKPAPAVPAAGLGRLTWAGSRLRVGIRSADASAEIVLDAGKRSLRAERHGAPGDWAQEAPWEAARPAGSEAMLFLDGPLIEFFSPIDGASVTMALEQASGPLHVVAEVDGRTIPFAWTCFA